MIESIDDAATWVRGTFLFTRIRRNPGRYGLVGSSGQVSDESATSFLHEKLRLALQELKEAGIVDLDKDGILVSPFKPSAIMSRNMLQFSTMKAILAQPLDCSIEDVLKFLR